MIFNSKGKAAGACLPCRHCFSCGNSAQRYPVHHFNPAAPNIAAKDRGYKGQVLCPPLVLGAGRSALYLKL